MRISAGELFPPVRDPRHTRSQPDGPSQRLDDFRTIADPLRHDGPRSSDESLRIQRGFTMIEILIVMVILGLMAALVTPNIMQTGNTARTKITQSQIATLANSLHTLALDCGRYPSTQEGLEALLERPADMNGWNGPYLESDFVPADAWQNDFVYRGPDGDGRFEIVSYGSDGAPGGDDQAADISSRRLHAAKPK